MRWSASQLACCVAGCCAVVLLVGSTLALASPEVYVGSRFQPVSMRIREGGNYRQVSVDAIKWSSWNDAVAVGTGTYVFRFCAAATGSCTNQPFYQEAAIVKLSRIVSCHGRAHYTSLAVSSNGPVQNPLFEPFRATIKACRIPSRHGH
jgi:hypothetical protein